jgi:crotonobetainyl-CoA:carnitine CoA-transferase CaiB-like acyl-CoA transferase
MPARLTPEPFGAEMAAAGRGSSVLPDNLAARDGSLPMADQLDAWRSEALHQWQPPGGGAPGALSQADIHSLYVPLIFACKTAYHAKLMTPALDKVVVLDFSRVLAGPFATMLLGDLGAEVLKVERPGGGDDTRGWLPPVDHSGQSTYFQSANRNKASIVLDLASPSGAAKARHLARNADVVVENFRPGVMEHFGLGYSDIAPHNPGLIYCSITAFGHGAGASLPGYDLLVQALGGLMSITGEPDGKPQKVGVAVVDVLTGLFATVGILAALQHRNATGEGQFVEVNLLMSLLASLVNHASAYTIAGVVPRRIGNAHPSVAPYELFHTADGDLVLAAGNDRQFGALCSVLAVPHLALDPRFARNADRVANRQLLHQELEASLLTAGSKMWAERLLASGVPAGEVNDIGAAFDLAQRLGLNPIVALKRDDGATVRLTRNPVSLSKTPPVYRMAAPSLPVTESGPT